MELDQRACHRARRSRDARFDGRFFIAVTSTGIYCRPICPSRSAKDEHVRYFPTADAAEAAGFRPRLRCRPEASPGTPAWLGTSGLVSRALRLISEGALDQESVERLAERLDITGRHLRRLFLQHLGATPLEVALTVVCTLPRDCRTKRRSPFIRSRSRRAGRTGRSRDDHHWSPPPRIPASGTTAPGSCLK
jgi:AraC family transcriptional regulator of adaptative response / DNA-3-methyladenine glycosylase II